MPVKLLSSENPQAYGAADKKGAILYIQSTITGYTEEFPAFLTDFSQTFQSNWNTEEVYGRNDPIATFQGTKRTISLGFDLPAGSIQDAKNNLNRCSNLIQMMYPGYHPTSKTREVTAKQSPRTKEWEAELKGGDFAGVEQENFGALVDENIATGNVIGKSPLVKITFGNLIRAGVGPPSGKIGADGLLGWIGSLSWKPNLEMGMFVADQGEFYPKVISLSFDFNVLHQTELGQSKKKKTGTVNGWLAVSENNKNFPFK
tara:strand:- start:404 stop:1180 length:777 start_codon:yes stop_codon:yes gene_type:complete